LPNQPEQLQTFYNATINSLYRSPMSFSFPARATKCAFHFFMLAIAFVVRLDECGAYVLRERERERERERD